jgi:hypothetical protein
MNTMKHKGYSAQVMESKRLVGEELHGLPPGSALDVYPGETFNTYPENWVTKGAFVIPVKPNKGLWFNFRMNDEYNTAILMTVKGCNPITGLQSSGFHLDKYVDKCPKHGCDFVSERFCPECGYKWPDRSYLSGSPLWWDGWVSEGAIRQFFFTEEMMRDVATHMIGKENTVPAFGFAFYSPKEPRPSYPSTFIYHCTSYGSSYIKFGSSSIHSAFPPQNKMFYSSPISDGTLGGEIKSKSSTRGLDMSKRSRSVSYSVDSPKLMCSAQPDSLDYSMDFAPMVEEKTSGGTLSEFLGEIRSFVPQKEVAVGAGAKIRQELPEDTNPLDSWKDTPDSVMTIYFVFQEEFDKMAAGGFKDFSDCKDGMLKGLPVG